MPAESLDPKTVGPRYLAFYLPQYHPIAENDAWWGTGFTEWRNVVKGRPLFRGHEQPRLPGELGFYDLRVPEVRETQSSLAREHGIGGFCYYHYWFSGHRVLDRPFTEVLASGRPRFPFCLCWANEDWTRAWDGRSQEVLLAQSYSERDDREHIRALLPAFADDRYIRVDGRPLFLVYRSARMPDVRATTALWRAEARAHGIGDLFLCRVESFHDERGDPRPLGFDAAVEFQPDWLLLPARRNALKWMRARARSIRTLRGGHVVHRYGDLVRAAIAKPTPTYPRFPGVTPSWDNTSRRATGAVVFEGSTPEAYGTWLDAASMRAMTAGLPEPLVFINAWNEWAEGSTLEPSERWGRRYLEVQREVFGRFVDLHEATSDG